jgi:hypothetical protein
MARPSKEYSAFTKLTDKLLSVPRTELQKRLDAYKEKAAHQPNKRGPKPKKT